MNQKMIKQMTLRRTIPIKDESTTEDNTPKDTEEKPDFKEPTEIEEDDK